MVYTLLMIWYIMDVSMRFTTNENIVVKQFHKPSPSQHFYRCYEPSQMGGKHGIVLTTMVWMCFFNGVYYYQISWIFGAKTNVTIRFFQKKQVNLVNFFWYFSIGVWGVTNQLRTWLRSGCSTLW